MASSAASDFVADAGPGFEPGEEEPPAAAEPMADPFLPEWEEESVRSILQAQGLVVHTLAGVGEEDWIYTEADLGAIAPPLTRILNRYDATRAAAGTGDEVAVLIGLGGYVGRSYQERRQVLAELEDEEEVPVSGQAAPEGTGPPQESTPEEGIEWSTP